MRAAMFRRCLSWLAALCFVLLAASQPQPSAACSVSSLGAREAIGESLLVARGGVEPTSLLSSGSTTLLTGAPVRRSDFLSSVDFVLSALPAQLYVQLFTPTPAGYQLKSTTSLFSYAAGGAEGLQRHVVLNWQVAEGDVVGFALLPGGSSSISSQPAAGYPQAESWVTQWAGMSAILHSKLATTPTHGSVQRIYSFSVNLQRDCVSARFPPCSCSLSPSPLSSALNQTDGSAAIGASVLLIGQAAPAGDVLRTVSMVVRQLLPFVLQVWRPSSANVWSVRHSLPIAPAALGQLTVPVHWSLRAGDVIGWSTQSSPAATGGPIAFEDDEELLSSTLTVRADLQGTAPERITILTGVTPGDRVLFAHRQYAIQLHTEVSCVLVRGGERQLSSRRLTPDEGHTTLLVGSTFNSSALLYSVTFQPLNAHAMQLQLLSGADQTLKFTMDATPSSEAVAAGVPVTVYVNWPVLAGDVLAYHGTVVGQSTPVGYSTDDVLGVPSAAVQLLNGTLSSTGPSDMTGLTDAHRRVNLQFVLRPYGLCSGAGSEPDNGEISSCSLIRSGATCRFECATGYSLEGAALTCNAGSIGLLSGSESCAPRPCTFSLPANNGGATMGTCNATLVSGSTCRVSCPVGKVSLQSTTVSCRAAIISSEFQQCITPASCAWPAADVQLPVGLLAGNCTVGETVPHGASCKFQVDTGFALVNGSLVRSCFNGIITPLPQVSANPCPLPALAAHVNMGTCNGSVLPSGGPVCSYACDYGYLPRAGSTALNCTGGVLLGQATVCYAAPACTLPVTLPEGLDAGTCKGLTTLDPLNGSCFPSVKAGYTVSGELAYRCVLGDLRSNFTVVATPCTLPISAPSRHVVPGDCTPGEKNLTSGTVCSVKCASGYVTWDSTFFSCFLGSLSGTLPQCRLPVCSLPTSLPDGVLPGTCVLGSMLRNDSEIYPSSCVLALEADYVLSNGSLTLTCAADGTLSELPEAVSSIFPISVQSSTCSGNDGAAAISDVVTTGAASCPSGYALSSWKFDRCSNGGVGVRVFCTPHKFFSNGAVQSADGACLSGSLSALGSINLLECPSNHAAIGVSFRACAGGAQMQLSCRPLIDESSKFTLVGLFADDFTQEMRSTSGSTRFVQGSSLGDLPSVHSLNCFPNEFNYITALGLFMDADRLLQTVKCRQFHASQPGLLLSSPSWYGPAIHERSVLADERLPQCILMLSTRIQTTGSVFAVAFWASRLGDLTVQTYKLNAKGEYIVQGSVAIPITQLGYQQVGLPSIRRWQVDPSHVVGFCSQTQLIPGDPIQRMTTAGGRQSAHVLSYLGGAVAVGDKAGGGDDAGEISDDQLAYSFQLGVMPPATVAPAPSFGFNSSNAMRTDRRTDAGACVLMDQPRIRAVGTVTNFSFVAPSNDGEIILQTYQEEPLGSGNYLLTGSFTIPSLKRGFQSHALNESDQWQVSQGDILAFCHTRTSLAWELIYNPTAQWLPSWNGGFSQFDVYGRSNDHNSPHWLSFSGAGIQTEVGQRVLGSYTPGFWTVDGLSNVDRLYALEIGIVPMTACRPVAAVAKHGHGKVQCNTTICTLICDPGYGALKATQRCSSDASWDEQGTCVPVASPTFVRSWSLPELSQYSVTLRWQPPSSLGGLLLQGWELQSDLLFPSNSDLQLPALKSLLEQGSVRTLQPLEQSYTLVLDADAETEHAIASLRLRMLVSGGSSAWIPLTVASACACDLYHALLDPVTNDDQAGFGSVQSGQPLEVAASQAYGPTNSLQLSFLPNSLCTNQYVITTTAKDGTRLPLQQITVQAYKAATVKSCPFLHSMQSTIGQIEWPMYGRDLEVCITQGPMFVCGTCQTEYNSGVAPVSLFPTPPPVCSQVRLAFALVVRGSVTTAKSPSSTIVAGVDGVMIHFQLLEFDTDLPVLLMDEDGNSKPHLQSVVTDASGNYDIIIQSDQLAAVEYKLRYWPVYEIVDEISGLTSAHVFHSAQQPSENVTVETVTHNQFLLERNFIDESVVAVLGQVLLPPTSLFGSDAFQGCGVANITVTAYALSDTEFQQPLSTSEATLSDGRFQLTAGILSTIVLRATQEGVNRTFDSPTLLVHVGAQATVVEPIYDTTMAKLQLQLDGGNCGSHIGSVRPALFYDACGASAHILLPPFGSGAGAVYEVPAVSYTVKLFDSKDSLSGLQPVDLDGTVLPTAYVSGDVAVFVATTAPFNVDFRLDTLTQQNYSWHYFAPADTVLKNPFMCSDPKAQTSEQRYLIARRGSQITITFEVTETYGYIGMGGENRLQQCSNVTAGMEFLDGVTQSGAPLMADYAGCTTGSRVCPVTAVFDGSASLVTYTLVVGELQQSNFQTDLSDTAHTQPYYTRSLQYRSAGSAEPFMDIYVLIVGSQPTEGTMSLVYPPYDALYILRDPPGSGSFARLKVGTSLATATRFSLKTNSGTMFAVDGGVGLQKDKKLCLAPDIGAEFIIKIEAEIRICTTLAEISAVYNTHNTADQVGGFPVLQSQTITNITLQSEITTSRDPNAVDGEGDLFLTIDGTFSLQISQQIIVDILVEEDPLTHKETFTCAARRQPSLVWTRDPGASYTWVTQRSIKKIIIPRLEQTNQMILEEAHVADVDALRAVNEERAITYEQNQVAINGWNGLLQHNQKLKDEATAWTDFWQMARSPGATDGSPTATQEHNPDANAFRTERAKLLRGVPMPSLMKTRMPPEATADAYGNLVDENNPLLSTLGNVNHLSPQVQNPTNPELSANSILIYGDASGGQVLEFTVRTETTQSVTREGVETYSRELKPMHHALASNSWGLLQATGYYGLNMIIEHGARQELAQHFANELDLHFSDQDTGDQIHFGIFKDALGQPVYKIIGGQSSCPPEKGTVERDNVELLVNTPVFTRVHPSSSVSTSVTLINHSPTREDFDFSLTQLLESNTYGLRLYINGQVLNSDTSTMRVTVPYGVNVIMSLIVERGPAAYTFQRIGLKAARYAPSGGHCSAAQGVISVQYDQPCSEIEFSGLLAISGSFLINSANVARAGSNVGAQLAIQVRNPQFQLPGRQWLDLVKLNGGYLQSLDIQYRLDNSQSDADWQSIKRVGDTVPSTPLLKSVVEGYQASPPSVRNDVLTVTWDLSQLGDSAYQLRAMSQCDVPVGAIDTSLYTHVSSIIRGTLDLSVPKLFGAPLPAGRPWLPGQAISASFTKTLACDSYYGRARVTMWINPTLVTGPVEQGKLVPTLHVCSGNTISIELYAPVFSELIGRLLSVQVDQLVDTSGNPIQGKYVQWSFLVAPFDTASSSVMAAGWQMKNTLAVLVAANANVLTLEAKLSAEIAALVNRALDADLQPQPPAASSVSGLQAASVLISNLHDEALTGGAAFDVSLQPLPRFPGEAAAIYSPSDFAKYLQLAWSKRNNTDAALYPLLSTLLDSSPFKVTVQAVVAGPTASPLNTLAVARRTMHTMSVTHSVLPTAEGTNKQQQARRFHLMATGTGIPDYTLQSFHAGLVPPSVDARGSVIDTDVPRAILQFQWLVEGTTEQPYLRNDDVTVEYQLVPDSSTEPDVAARAQRSTLIADADVTMKLVSNVPIGQTRALYSLQISGFPSTVGGFTARFWITISNALAHYALDETVFIAGPPSAPVLQTLVQAQITKVQVTFLPSAKSGVAAAAAATDSDVSYSLSIELPSGDVVSVPDEVVTSSVLPSTTVGLPDQQVRMFDLSVLSSRIPELVLPLHGAAVNLTVGVTAVTHLSSAPMQRAVVRIDSMPAPLRVFRVSQVSLSRYLVRFHASLTEVATAYIVGVSRNDAAAVTRTEFAPTALRRVEGAANSTELDATIAATVSSSLLEAVVTIPESATGYTSLAFGVSVRTPLAETSMAMHAAPVPYAYVSAPTLVSARMVPGQVVAAANQSVKLEVVWSAPTSILPSRQLLRSFDLSYSIVLEGNVLSAEWPLGTVDASGTPTRTQWTSNTLTVPFMPDPTAVDRARSYVIIIRASMANSDSLAVAYRQDGTGVHTLQSVSHSLSLVLKASQDDFPLTPPSNTSTGPLPSVPVSLYPLEGVLDPLAPASLTGMEVTQLEQQPRHVRVLFVHVADAARYQLAWYNASSVSASGGGGTLLGSDLIDAAGHVDGWMVHVLPNLLKFPDLVHGARLKFALSAVGSNGRKSQRVVQYLSVAPRAHLLPLYDVEVRSANPSRGWPTLPFRLVGLTAWNCSIAGNVSVSITVTPRSGSLLRSVSALLVHEPRTPDQVHALFEECSKGGETFGHSIVLPPPLSSLPTPLSVSPSSAASTLSGRVVTPTGALLLPLSTCNGYTFQLPPITANVQRTLIVYLRFVTDDFNAHLHAMQLAYARTEQA